LNKYQSEWDNKSQQGAPPIVYNFNDQINLSLVILLVKSEWQKV